MGWECTQCQEPTQRDCERELKEPEINPLTVQSTAARDTYHQGGKPPVFHVHRAKQRGRNRYMIQCKRNSPDTQKFIQFLHSVYVWNCCVYVIFNFRQTFCWLQFFFSSNIFNLSNKKCDKNNNGIDGINTVSRFGCCIQIYMYLRKRFILLLQQMIHRLKTKKNYKLGLS